MDLLGKGTLKPLLVPGGVLFLAALLGLQTGVLALPAAAIPYYFFAVFGGGMLLAWRFHSSRVLFALLTLFLAGRALDFFFAGRTVPATPGRIALEAVALLLPLNFLALALARERGFVAPAIVTRLVVLFVESVFIAVICRPGADSVPGFLHPALLDRHLFAWSKIPQLSWLVFALVWTALLLRFLRYRKPVESGLLWALAAAFAALQAGGMGPRASAYFASAGLILASSIIENSYVLAYQDELSGLPARRAFNEALLHLQDKYSVAMVDIDHFKSFNDTYGHETGDQVLRMVAARLARVSGGGRAFRVGGEEFCVIFSGESVKDALPHLELLRTEIENSSFRMRGQEERRRTPQPTTDRRKTVRRKASRPHRKPVRSFSGELSVTVSIGVAESGVRTREVEQVIHAADQALYSAKQAGRNRVETALARPKPKRNIA